MTARCLRTVSLALSLLGLAGCAYSGAYSPITDPDFKGPTLQAVRSNPGGFLGRPVRWGGRITRVENRSDATLIEVVEQPLYRYGRPQRSSDTQGRFLARFEGFLDPAVYDQDQPITVVGTLMQSLQGRIGEYPYEFPVVAVNEHRLWEDEPDYGYDPWLYGYHYPPYFYGHRYGFGYHHRLFHPYHHVW